MFKLISKTSLINHVIIFSSMVYIMIHCSAIYTPITYRPIFNSRWKLAVKLISIKKDHLKPQLLPAQITNRIIFIHFNLPTYNWSDFHYLSINDIGELSFPYLFHDKIKYIFRSHFFAYEITLYGLELKFICSK